MMITNDHLASDLNRQRDLEAIVVVITGLGCVVHCRRAPRPQPARARQGMQAYIACDASKKPNTYR